MEKALPAGPKGDLLTGHVKRLQAHWGNALAADVAEFGNVIPYRLGPRPYLFINEPALIEEVMFKKHRAFGRGDAHRLAEPLQGKGLFLNDNYESWLGRRRMMAPAFHKSALDRYVDIIIDTADAVFAALPKGQPFDIYPHTTRISMQVVAKALFGSEVGDGHELQTSLQALMAAFNERMDSVVPWPSWMPLPSILRMRRAVEGFDRVIARFVQAHRPAAARGEAHDFLGMLMTVRDEAGQGLTDRQVRDEAVTLLFAGFETTASSLAVAFHHLAAYPEMQAKLRAEVAEKLGQRRPALSDLAALTYTTSFVSEVFRLYPAAWGIVRQASERTDLGGYPVKRGWHVMLSPWVLHRDTRYWRTPDVFDPERWLDGSTDQLPKCTYLPFGAGGRICLGAEFARVELAIVLARLVQSLSLRAAPNAKLELELGWTVRPKGAVEVVAD